jgi:hypothetical protein
MERWAIRTRQKSAQGTGCDIGQFCSDLRPEREVETSGQMHLPIVPLINVLGEEVHNHGLPPTQKEQLARLCDIAKIEDEPGGYP